MSLLTELYGDLIPSGLVQREFTLPGDKPDYRWRITLEANADFHYRIRSERLPGYLNLKKESCLPAWKKFIPEEGLSRQVAVAIAYSRAAKLTLVRYQKETVVAEEEMGDLTLLQLAASMGGRFTSLTDQVILLAETVQGETEQEVIEAVGEDLPATESED